MRIGHERSEVTDYVTGYEEFVYTCAQVSGVGVDVLCRYERTQGTCGRYGQYFQKKVPGPLDQAKTSAPSESAPKPTEHQIVHDWMMQTCQEFFGPRQSWTKEQFGHYLNGLGLLLSFVDRK
jgi:hypothetical protein